MVYRSLSADSYNVSNPIYSTFLARKALTVLSDGETSLTAADIKVRNGRMQPKTIAQARLPLSVLLRCQRLHKVPMAPIPFKIIEASCIFTLAKANDCSYYIGTNFCSQVVISKEGSMDHQLEPARINGSSVIDGENLGEVPCFPYGETETSYLAAKDKRMAEVIEAVGHVSRPLDPDLFSATAHHIIGQQVSLEAQRTVWERMQKLLGEVTPKTVAASNISELQACGMTFRKAEYIYEFAQKVHSGAFDVKAVAKMCDEDAIAALSSLRGIGTWTAEMILLFCLGRKNIFAYDDLAIQRGLRMVYHHRAITRPLFEKYRRRFSPYCSIASLYLWEVSKGAMPQLRDHAPKSKAAAKSKRKR